MKLINLHNHTRCAATPRIVDDYVEAAIRQGAAIMGFSDHAPLPSGLRENVTMSPEQTEGYIAMLESARKKFQGRVEILIGFEVDFPLHEDFSRSYFFDERIDYLIGSCHFIDGWPSTMRATSTSSPAATSTISTRVTMKYSTGLSGAVSSTSWGISTW